MLVLKVLFFLVTGYYIFCAIYIVVYAVAGLFYKNPTYPKSNNYRNFAILVPAYKADMVIEDLANNVLLQNYPKFDIIIIADSLAEDVLRRLKAKPIKVIEFSDANRTKALALNTIMSQLPSCYDVALILDSDNLIQNTDYLQRLNDAFETGIQVIQTHRTAKNTNTSLAVLDAASEEINNQLFRRGHAALGLSSALIGSAMAFDYQLYKEQMLDISSSGEDKELEMKLLKKGCPVIYIDDLIVLDEKTQQADSFVTQRARWIANQIMQARSNVKEGFIQLFRGNFDFFDKVLQHFLLPRIFLLSTVLLFSLLSVIFLPSRYSTIWLMIVVFVCFSLLVSIPKKMYNKQLFKSLWYLPKGFVLMILSLFKIRGATKKFHATEHFVVTNNIIPKNVMHIGIDAQRLFRKQKFGMDVVTLELIQGLQKIDQTNEYVIFVAPGENKCLKETANFTICEINNKLYPVWEQISLPKVAKAMKVDFLHCTSNTAPFRSRIPFILTLHDTISLEDLSNTSRNKTWYQKIGHYYRHFLIPKIVSKSMHIFTVSNTEKENIVNLLHIRPEMITTVYNGVSERFVPITDLQVKMNIRQKYQLPEHYIAFIGNSDPRKNVTNTLRAYAEYWKKSDVKKMLVMLHNDKHTCEMQIVDAGLSHLRDKIILLGYINSADMPAFYSLADMFLYPSIREGFGIPVLESMACGTPVITSNISSMPEIGGDAVLYASPYDYKDIARQMLFLEKYPQEGDRLVALGLIRCRNFSWDITAHNVLNIYKKVYSQLKIQ